MMPIQAVIGIEALDFLDSWIEHRRKIANIYNENLKNIVTKGGVRLTIPSKDIYHSYYKYYFFIKPDKFKISRDKIIKEINDSNITARVGSCSEVYLEEALKEFKPNKKLVNTQELFETGIMLLCDPTISETVATSNILVIKDILSKHIK